MSTSLAPSPVSAGQKRSFHESSNDMDSSTLQSPATVPASSILTPTSTTPSHKSSIDMATNSREGSPISVLSSAPTSMSNANANSTGPPAKKRKLTFAEKEAEREVKRKEKEERERHKAEEKAKKEEEKRLRDEDKRRKEEEKEATKRQKELEKAEKQKVKDAEKHVKEEKKRKEEEDKQKKERSQLRLNAFFKTPAPAPAPADDTDLGTSAVNGRRGSTASIGEAVSTTQNVTTKNDYESEFHPFCLRPNVQLAPYVGCQRDENATKYALQKLENAWTDSNMDIDIDPFKAFRSAPYASRSRGRLSRQVPIREFANRDGGSSTTPIDLTSEGSGKNMLRDVAMKYLFFQENVRPPYHGTYSRRVSQRSASKLARKPFTRALPDTNYDYDSEAEWEPPQEGDEDLVSEEDDESEDDGDDMEGFLDDEADLGRRKFLGGDMAPISTGLIWADECADGRAGDVDLNALKINVISNEHVFPIDPFSTKYWVNPATDPSHLTPTPMQPPSRTPLGSVKPSNAIYNQGTLTPTTQGSGQPALTVDFAAEQPKSRSSKPLKLISPELLPEFKQAVHGNNLSKAGLIEVLKKQFPKVAKDVIRDTLTSVATREGVKEVDKVWVLIEG